MNIYDTIIIGAGPAGLTAGIYAGRKEMKTLIIGQDVGGQMTKTATIENYPGIEKIDGVSLGFKIKQQAESFGVEFEIKQVKQIKPSNTAGRQVKQKLFEIDCGDKKYQTKSVILAFGLEKKKLGIKNEKKFIGQGLSYCVTCDGPLFKNKPVAVVGGANAGAEAVEFLAKICPKVYWIEVMNKLNVDKILIDRISKLDNIEAITSIQIVELIGKDKLEGIKIKPADSKSDRILKQVQDDILRVDGLFVEIGYRPQNNWLKNLVALDKSGQIKVDNLCQTNVPGIFAAGDCTDVKYKQIVVAEGMGAVAALESYNFVQKGEE